MVKTRERGTRWPDPPPLFPPLTLSQGIQNPCQQLCHLSGAPAHVRVFPSMSSLGYFSGVPNSASACRRRWPCPPSPNWPFLHRSPSQNMALPHPSPLFITARSVHSCHPTVTPEVHITSSPQNSSSSCVIRLPRLFLLLHPNIPTQASKQPS